MRFPLTVLASLLTLAMTHSDQPPASGAQQVDSTTLVPDKVFTDGIEGPGVDREGLLHVVNFAREGTIGVVRPDGHAELYVTLPSGSTGNGIRFGPPPGVDAMR